MTLATNLMMEYWRQNQTPKPLITDGLIVYEPFDAPRVSTYIGNMPMVFSGGTPDWIAYQGVQCIGGCISTIRPYSLNLAGKPISACVWANISKRNYSWLGYFINNNNSWFISNQQNADRFHIRIGSIYTENITVPQDTWVHCALTCDPQRSPKSIAYINGKQVDTRDYSYNMTTDTVFWMSYNNAPDSGGRAYASRFYMFDRALTAAEVSLLSNEFTPTT